MKEKELLLEFLEFLIPYSFDWDNEEHKQHMVNKFICSYQPERLSPEALEDGFDPPPWNIYENPEKTEGWIEYQMEMRKGPKHYLQGCDSPNSENK